MLTRRSLLQAGAAVLALPATLLGKTSRNQISYNDSTGALDLATVGEFHPPRAPFEVGVTDCSEYLFDTKTGDVLFPLYREEGTPPLLTRDTAAYIFNMMKNRGLEVPYFCTPMHKVLATGRDVGNAKDELARLQNVKAEAYGFRPMTDMEFVQYHGLLEVARRREAFYEEWIEHRAIYDLANGLLVLFDKTNWRIAFALLVPKEPARTLITRCLYIQDH